MITGTITVADYMEAMRLHHQRDMIQILFWVGAGFVVGLGLMATGDKTFLPYLLLFGGGAGLAVILYLWCIHIPRQAKRRLTQYRELGEATTYEWDSKKLGGQTSAGQGRRPWAYYIKRKENEKLILLYMTDSLFHMIPKRWFTSPAQLEEFKRYASVIRA